MWRTFMMGHLRFAGSLHAARARGRVPFCFSVGMQPPMVVNQQRWAGKGPATIQRPNACPSGSYRHWVHIQWPRQAEMAPAMISLVESAHCTPTRPHSRKRGRGAWGRLGRRAQFASHPSCPPRHARQHQAACTTSSTTPWDDRRVHPRLPDNH